MNETELATAVSPLISVSMEILIVSLQLDLPAGLTNLGNTCYMNATVQCLKIVPELREALQNYQGGCALFLFVFVLFVLNVCLLGIRCSDSWWGSSSTVDYGCTERSVCQHGQGQHGSAHCTFASTSHGFSKIRRKRRTWRFYPTGERCLKMSMYVSLFLYFMTLTSHDQDANECWTEIVRMLQQKLPPKESNGLPQEEKFK